jgi:hypothetical protein
MLKLNIERVAGMPPCSVLSFDADVEVWRDNEGLIAAYGEVRGDEYLMHLPGLATYCFAHDGDEVSARVSADTRDELVVDAYFRRVLPMALQVRGREVLHASAAQFPSGVVAMCGRSSSGKSTIAYGLSRRGYALWSDDSLVLDLSDRVEPVLLPFRVKLRPSAAELFDVRSPASALTACQTHNAPTARLSLIVLLHQDPEVTSPVTVRRLSAVEAFASVLAHAYVFSFQDPARKRRMMQHYFQLAARIPVVEIRFQPGLDHLPTVLDEIEQTAKACA